MRARLAGTFLLLQLLSCSARDRQPEPVASPDALAPLKSHPELAVHLARAIDPRAVKRSNWASTALKVDLPTAADGAVRLSRHDRPEAWLTLTPRVTSAPPLSVQAHAHVFARALPATDVVHFVAPGRYEETRVLHGKSAPERHSWTLAHGAEVKTVRVRDRLVEAVDATGYVLFVQHPPFAVDAQGTRRELTPRLEGDTLSLDLEAADLAYPVVLDPTWSVVAPTATPRSIPGIALLPDGKILLAGGRRVGTAYPAPSTAEIYDPTTNTWSSAGTFPTAGLSGALVTLPGGKALLFGNRQGSPPSNLTAIWSGGTTWTAGPNMLTTRASFGFEKMADGRVLVVGGTDSVTSQPASTGEVYDPTTNTWTATGPLAVPRFDVAPARLADGRMMIVGGSVWDTAGINYVSRREVDLLDPVTLKWTPGTPIPEERSGPLFFVRSSGDVDVFQGYQYFSSGASILRLDRRRYHPTTGVWDATSPVTLPLALTLNLSDGRLLFPNSVDAIVHDPVADTFFFAGATTTTYTGRAYVAMADGRAMVANGRDLSVTVTTLTTEVDVWSQLGNGVACTDDYECKSGHCTDGVCCGSGSCGVGKSCNSAAAKGTCKAVAGFACTTNADCGTGFCADGVCCNRACSGQCEACDDPFSLGTCKAISGAPHGTRTACSDGVGNPCKATVCNGTDAAACHAPAAGTVSCGSNRCDATTGTELHVGTCDSGGSCVASSKSCGAYACGATTCRTSCSVSTECAAGYWCSGGSCVATLGLGKPCSDSSACNAKLSCVDGVCCGAASCPTGGSCALPGHEGSCFVKNGGPCTVDAACGSGICADGVCCESRCDGQCEACDAKGSEGVCSVISGAPHGGRTACDSDPAQPCKSAACDGKDRTKCLGLAGAETTCQPQRCEAGKFTASAVCDGKGACAATAPTSCSGYTCENATDCRTSCKDDGDCVDGFRCDASKCTAITATCSSDGTQTVPTGGAAPIACAPYVCRAGACLKSCATSSDCSGGTVCSFATKTCIAPTEAASSGDEGGGCSTGRARSGSSGLLLLVFASVLAFRRRMGVAMAATALTAGGCGKESAKPSETRSPLLQVRTLSPSFVAFGRARARTDALMVRLPERADAPLHLEAKGDPSFALDVRDLDLRPATTRVEDAARVHVGALPETTILHAEVADGAEELRLLEGPRAPTTFRFSVTAGPAVKALRLREGRVEALDDRGVVRLSSAPMWAVDARGARRDLGTVVLAATPSTLVVEARLDVAGLSWPVVIDPAWSAAPSMSVARYQHTATVLTDGRVLVAGGYGDTVALANTAGTTAEIFDPATKTWAATGKLNGAPRSAHAATRLGAKVLVAGGSNQLAATSLSTSEVWDPTTGAWTVVGALPESRSEAQLVTLASGKALLFGGDLNDPSGTITPTNRAFLFDATTSTWSETGVMTNSRLQGASAVLSDGKVLAIGGRAMSTGALLTTVERYDPSTGAWSAVAPTKIGRIHPNAIAYAGGTKVLVVGGTNGFPFGTFSTTEIYDVSTNTWSDGPVLPGGSEYPLLAVLGTGKVMVAGGSAHNLPQATYRVFNPSTSTWTGTGTLPYAVINGTLTTLSSGATLLAGGSGGAIGEWLGQSGSYVFAPQANGNTCVNGEECTSGFCTEGVCCEAAACVAGSTCAGKAKPGSCTKRDAVTCTTSAECASGFCVDGVCCESACAAQCAACDVPGNVGHCRPVKGAPHGSRTACSTTECGPTCDGSDTAACHARASGTPCGSNACVSGKELKPSTCDGAGACIDTSTSCGAYACGATACKTSCASGADCASGFVCTGTTCVPLPGKGSDCSTTGACGAGLTCVGGVCCGAASCPGDSVCALGVGDCVKVDGAKCATNDDCKNKHCVDGYCCNEACDGACSACDVAGREGKCSAVSGKPHGARTCPSDPSDPCSAATCNGADKTTCASKAGADVSCRAATCADGKAVSAAFCNGTGACPAAITTECGAYQCNADGTACRTRCTEASDCAKNAWCNAGKCEELAGLCSADGSSLEIKGAGSASCAPYVCRDNACKSSCESSGDCAGGYACDTGTKTCIAAEVTSGDDGGCTYGAKGTGLSGLAVLVLGLASAGRRRRAA